MQDQLEIEFNKAMLDIYRRAKSEARYNAQRFLQMVIDHGGLETARMLINSVTVSEGYTALWERGRLDLTVESMVLETKNYHPLFTREELQICAKRLKDYNYKTSGDERRRLKDENN
jgi:hypothetical protein